LNKVVEFFIKDKWLKLLSLALAVVLWVFVSQETYKREPNIEVALEFRVPEDKFLLSQQWSSVQISLRGPTQVMEQLRPENLFAEIDVASKLRDRLPATLDGPKQFPIQVKPSDIRNLPATVRVTRLYPDEVRITLDQVIAKRLTVSLDKPKEAYEQELKPGLRLEKMAPLSKYVMVQGPKSILKEVEAIETEPVDVRDLEECLWQPYLPLKTSVGPYKGCLAPDPPKVRFYIRVVLKQKTKTVQDVPIQVLGRPGFQYTLWNGNKTEKITQIKTVEIRGPERQLDEHRLRALVDLTDVTNPGEAGSVTRTVRFDVAEGFEVVTEPPKVVAEIKAPSTE
jgi:hypothetical protein